MIVARLGEQFDLVDLRHGMIAHRRNALSVRTDDFHHLVHGIVIDFFEISECPLRCDRELELSAGLGRKLRIAAQKREHMGLFAVFFESVLVELSHRLFDTVLPVIRYAPKVFFVNQKMFDFHSDPKVFSLGFAAPNVIGNPTNRFIVIHGSSFYEKAGHKTRAIPIRVL